MSGLRIGLVGAGPWARTHLAHLMAHPQVEVSGVWARRPEAARELVGDSGIAVHESFDDLVAASEAIDLTVPPAAQVELASRAAAAGRHLFLEKPIAADLAGARALATACREAGVVTQVMLTRRFNPVVRDFLAECATALPRDTVSAVAVTYVHGAFLGGKFATPWRLSEGVLLDLGPHVFDLVEQVAGPFEAVRARISDRLVTTVDGRHAGGALSSMVFSGHVPVDDDHFRLDAFGSTGSRSIDSASLAQADDAASFATALDEFVAAVRTGAPVLADVERGVALQRVIEAAYAAARSGSEIEIASLDG